MFAVRRGDGVGGVARAFAFALDCFSPASLTVVMAGGIGVGFVLGLLYASQRRRPVPATLYRVASKDVDAAGLADLALAEVV